MHTKEIKNVYEVVSATSLFEWNLQNRLEESFGSQKLGLETAFDETKELGQKCLRFSIIKSLATQENVSMVAAFIHNIVTDAEITLAGEGLVNPALSEAILYDSDIKQTFAVGQKLKCINSGVLKDNENGPELVQGEIYPVNEIILDAAGNQHLDVGLVSKLAYVTSYDNGERLERGDKIHWCHPSRFRLLL